MKWQLAPQSFAMVFRPPRLFPLSSSPVESEIINDYNDRAIRESVKYFQNILSTSEKENCEAILLTNDAANSVSFLPPSSLPAPPSHVSIETG
jgi:hypothetical protein